MVIDPTYLGLTSVDAQALCLKIFNLSLTQNTFIFAYGIKRMCLLQLEMLNLNPYPFKLGSQAGYSSAQ